MSVPFVDYMNNRPKKKFESSNDSRNNEGQPSSSNSNNAFDYFLKRTNNDSHQNPSFTPIIRFNCDICTENKSTIQEYITEHVKPLLNSQRMAPKRILSVMKYFSF